ncbi:MAG TPA: hypothetical protein VJ901_14045 [Thermoanaerobaculia bacterium]|nr:hypothetical protein [Thermoanaerobaculia bacterium]
MTSIVLALLLSTSLSINTNTDSHARIVARHEARDARLVITTKHRAVLIMLLKDAVAVQLTDSAMADMKTKDDAGFFEELLVSGVRLALGKSVEYPIANIRSAELRDGVLVLTNDEGKPVFDQIKVNGENVTHDIAPADAARFVNAFRALKR